MEEKKCENCLFDPCSPTFVDGRDVGNVIRELFSTFRVAGTLGGMITTCAAFCLLLVNIVFLT